MEDLTIRISELALGKLQVVAAGDREAVEEMLSKWIEQLVLENQAEKRKNAFLMIAEAAEKLGEGSEENDIAERSREILKSIYREKLGHHTQGYEGNE